MKVKVRRSETELQLIGCYFTVANPNAFGVSLQDEIETKHVGWLGNVK